MAILRCGNSIRLNGKDAEAYLSDTGRKILPKSVGEYNLAMQEIKTMWLNIDTPESRLLAAVCFAKLDIFD